MPRRLLVMLPVLAALAAAGLLLGVGDRPAVAPGPPSLLPLPTVPASSPAAASPSPTSLPPLTLADVFDTGGRPLANLDPARLRTLVATGDVIPARYTDVTIRNHGDDFSYPFAATTAILTAADVTVINLEAPLIGDCPYHDSGFVFCGRPGFAGALAQAGVDVATLENNHIGNYGPRGVEETHGHLEAAGVRWADSGTPAIVDVRGLRFGFLAFNGVGAPIDRDAMAQAIAALRPQVDVLAVAVHWGAEYVSLPQAAPGIADDDPVEIAHLAVDSGADIVLGNHPHWVQAVEIYRGKLITYAHGNFIFDQMWSYETRVGVVGKYTFSDAALVSVEFIPVLIHDWAQPVPLEGEEAQAVLDRMRGASETLAQSLAAN